MHAPDVLAVGDVMLDVAVAGAGHAAVIHVGAGGSSANVAVWAAHLGARAAVVGRVGDDLAGRMIASALEERGVRALLSRDGARRTGCVVAGADGVVVDRGATAALAVEDLPGTLHAGAVVVSGYALFQRGSGEAARTALERADASWVAVDAGTGAVPARLEDAARADALLLDEAAARALTGLDPDAAARELGRRFRLACVTRGPAGAVASLDGELVGVPAPRVEAVDSVGAGDAFAAGLLVALLRGARLRAALESACRLGADAVALPGRWPPAD